MRQEAAPIYLDYNASTPIDPTVAAAMRPFLDGAFGNPSSGHWASASNATAIRFSLGRQTKEAEIDAVVERLARIFAATA